MSLLDAFVDHWRTIPRNAPGAGLVPLMRDYLDRPNPLTQPWTLLLDVEEQRLTVRLIGTMLSKFIGIELTGSDQAALFPDDQRAEVLRRHAMTASHPCGMRTLATALTVKGRALDMVTIALPLLRSSGGVSLARVVQVLQPLDNGDQVKQLVTALPQATWFDIGNGVPDMGPAP
jgi:PAS domain